MFRATTAAAMAVVVLTQSVSAANYSDLAFMNGIKLYDMCRNDAGRSFLTGYMEGLLDAEGFFMKSVKKPRLLCVPEGVVLDRLADIACKYLSDHPEERHQTGASLAINEVYKSFACPGTVKPCGKRGADVLPDFNWNRTATAMMGHR
jgi:hypothetical protein